MKALSLWQPWGTLVVDGFKLTETRSWYTRHRGGLVIHAALKWTKEIRKIAAAEPFRSHLETLGYGLGKDDPRPPLRALLGTVELFDVWPADLVRFEKRSTIRRTPDIPYHPERSKLLELPRTEEPLGDFNPWRWVWLLRHPIAFRKPIAHAGNRGLFEVPNKLFSKTIGAAVEFEGIEIN